MTSTIKVDTISENTSANGVAIDGVTLKDGAIGIGTTSPSTDLHIKSTADNAPHLLLENFQNADTDDAPVIELYLNDQTTGGIGDDTDVGVIRFTGDEKDGGTKETYAEIRGVAHDPGQGTGNKGHLSFFVQSAGSLAETMTLDESRVGIGTNAPDMLLDVTGAISAGAGTDEDLQQWNIGSDNVKAKMTYLDASANRGFAIGTSTQHDFFLRTNNNIGLKVDINGAVTKPLQPAFLGVNSAQQSDIADGHVLIDIDTEIFDQNADFNTGTHTFTAPVTGKYAFMVNVTVSDLATNYQWVYCYIGTSNRTAFVSTIDPRSLATASGYSLGGSILIDMDANDTALLYFRSSAHGDNTVNIVSAGTTNPETYFSGYLVA